MFADPVLVNNLSKITLVDHFWVIALVFVTGPFDSVYTFTRFTIEKMYERPL